MLYIVGCTNRKRHQPVPGLRASTLPESVLSEVAAIWAERVADAVPTATAGDLYCGRSFHEAGMVFRRSDVEGYVVSAGLGLVACDASVPAYSLTLTGPAEDDVRLKIRGEWSSGAWWGRVNAVRGERTGIAALVEARPAAPAVIVLSETYAAMVSDDLASLGDSDVGRLRIVGPRNAASLPERLRPCLMPFDDRLDGPAFPIPGTRADFAARAGRWFVEEIASVHPDGSAEVHAAAVAEALERFPPPPRFSRSPRTDVEIADLILANWERAEGKSSRMLRVLRDDLDIACEQSRFARLFRETAARRKETSRDGR
jgi:hypothetical protein